MRGLYSHSREYIEVACLQSELCTKYLFFLSYESSYEKCPEISPEIFEPLFCGSEKIPQNSHQISKISLRKIKKKITDELLQERREKNTGNIFEEIFPEYFANFLGEFIRCEYMPRLHSHPRANTGKYSWRIIYVLVSCQGVFKVQLGEPFLGI